MSKKSKTRNANIAVVNRVNKYYSNKAAGLDEAARKWLKLLADPCNAELAPPCYEVPGTGLLTRSHNIVVKAEARDYFLEFTPSFISPIRFGWSLTKGGSLGNGESIAVTGLIGSGFVGRARCAAACIKVIYTGTELDRQGLVGATLDAGVTINGNEPINKTAAELLTTCARVDRMGQVVHEFKWVPGPGDSDFNPIDIEEAGGFTANGNSLQVVLSGVSQGAFVIDITSVWEYQPSQEIASGIVTVMRSPPSSITFNQILRGLGDLGKFALNTAGSMGLPGLQPALAGAMRVGAGFLLPSN
jgi:hypothetical protein